MHPQLEQRVADISASFEKQFGQQPTVVARAPGRVNLIGDHTDYNEGFVLPAAIDKEVLIAALPNDNSSVQLYSCEYKAVDAFSLDDIKSTREHPWSNYVRGVLQMLQAAGFSLRGFRAAVSGNVPQGAGLSSSAAVEVAVGELCRVVNSLGMSPKEIALFAQKAENEFVGVKCGIMDQFVSALAEPDCALLIDCRSLESRNVPLHLGKHGLSIVITNSGVRRGLVESQYNARREECATGAKLLGSILRKPVSSLRDITTAQLAECESQLLPVVAKRCRHVVTENERVEQAVQALEKEDFETLGRLMMQSHQSLRDDFEVSCAELDTLIELTTKHKGTCGARMTGAGFGGCTVAIMATNSVDEFKSTVIPKYESQTGRKAEVYVCNTAAGGANIVVQHPESGTPARQS